MTTFVNQYVMIYKCGHSKDRICKSLHIDLQMRFYSTIAFVNQFNFKNATAFFTNAFNRKAALNKEYSFNLFALVLGTHYYLWQRGALAIKSHQCDAHCVSKHLYFSDIFFVEKVVAFTVDPAHIYMQAQALFLGRQYCRAFTSLMSLES